MSTPQGDAVMTTISPGHTVRIRDTYDGPWFSLRGKTGRVRCVLDDLSFPVGVEFKADALWYTPAKGEGRCFHFHANDLERVAP